MKIRKYLNPSSPLVKIDGEWVPLVSDGSGNLHAVDKLGKRKNFKVKTKPKSATGNNEIVVTPKGNTVVDKKDLRPKPVGYSSAFQGNLIMTPVRKGFELLGKGLYVGSQALERGFTYGPMSNSSGMFTFTQPELTTGPTPVTDATFTYGLPYTLPSKWVGWARTGYAPHREENTGLGDEDLNLMFDMGSTPLIFKGIKSGIKATPEVINTTIDNIANTNLGKRAAEVVMRSRLENHATANPIPDIIKGFTKAPWNRRMAVFDYILSGGKFINTADKPFGYRESFAPFKRYKSINDHFPKEVLSDRLKLLEAMKTDPQYNFGKYNGEQEVAYTGGFWGTHFPRREGYGDAVDAFLYGTEIDPAYGIKKLSTGNPEDFGIHKKYVEDYYPEQSTNVSVYETDKALNDNTIESNNIKSIEESDPIRRDIITSSSKYDAGGHRIEHGYYVDENGSPILETTYLLYRDNKPWIRVKKLPLGINEHPEITYTTEISPLKAYRDLDIYKFLPEDFKESWRIGGLGVRFIDKAGTPFIVRTPWRDSSIQYNKQGGKMNTLEFLREGRINKAQKGLEFKRLDSTHVQLPNGRVILSESPLEPTYPEFAAIMASRLGSSTGLGGIPSALYKLWRHHQVNKPQMYGSFDLGKKLTFSKTLKESLPLPVKILDMLPFLKLGNRINKAQGGNNSKSWINGAANIGIELFKGYLNKKMAKELLKIAESAIDADIASLKLQAAVAANLQASAILQLLSDPNNPNALGGDIAFNNIRNMLYNEHLRQIELDGENRKALVNQYLSLLNPGINWAGIALKGVGVLLDIYNLSTESKEPKITSVMNSDNKSFSYPGFPGSFSYDYDLETGRGKMVYTPRTFFSKFLLNDYIQ